MVYIYNGLCLRINISKKNIIYRSHFGSRFFFFFLLEAAIMAEFEIDLMLYFESDFSTIKNTVCAVVGEVYLPVKAPIERNVKLTMPRKIDEDDYALAARRAVEVDRCMKEVLKETVSFGTVYDETVFKQLFELVLQNGLSLIEGYVRMCAKVMPKEKAGAIVRLFEKDFMPVCIKIRDLSTGNSEISAAEAAEKFEKFSADVAVFLNDTVVNTGLGLGRRDCAGAICNADVYEKSVSMLKQWVSRVLVVQDDDDMVLPGCETILVESGDEEDAEAAEKAARKNLEAVMRQRKEAERQCKAAARKLAAVVKREELANEALRVASARRAMQ